MSFARTDCCVFSRNAIFTSIILLFLISLCIPVNGLTITISTDPTHAESGILPASYYEDQGKALMAEKDWSNVIRSTREGLEVYPYNPELLCLQAYALRKTGHYQESVDLVSLAIPNDTRPVRYANRGYGYLAMGKTGDALRDADSAIALNSSYTTAYALKASALRSAGNLSAAKEAISQALTVEPDNAYYLQVQGGILADMGNCREATEAFRHSIAINPDYDQPWPGLPNATTELEKTENICAAQGTVAPPTNASLPAGMLSFAAIAMVLVFQARRKQ
jgi:tetratricopeptide (TPR) repeat protein